MALAADHQQPPLLDRLFVRLFVRLLVQVYGKTLQDMIFNMNQARLACRVGMEVPGGLKNSQG